MMGVNLSAGGSLQWFRNALCQADVAAAKKQKLDVYDLLTDEAAQAPPGSHGLFFLPYLSGERTPHADPDARGCFVGLTLSHQPGAPDPGDPGGRDLFDAREPGDLRGTGRADPADSGLRRRRPQSAVAADPGRRLRPQGGNDQQRRGPGLRRGPAGGRGGRGLQQRRRGLRRHDPRRAAKPRPDRAAKRIYDRAFPVYQQLYRSLKNDFKTIAALDLP